MIGRIYCIYNTVDDQVCIGSTKRSLARRWCSYRCVHKNEQGPDANWGIHKLMRKYGFDKFYYELLEEIEINDDRDLTNSEGIWQDIFIENGYKLTNRKIEGIVNRHQRSKQKGTYQRRLERNKERVNCPNCRKEMSRIWFNKGHIKICRPKPRIPISVKIKTVNIL